MSPVFHNCTTTTSVFWTFQAFVSCLYNQLIFNDRQSEGANAGPRPINADTVAAAARRAEKATSAGLSITPTATSRARPQSDFSRGITRRPVLIRQMCRIYTAFWTASDLSVSQPALLRLKRFLATYCPAFIYRSWRRR